MTIDTSALIAVLREEPDSAIYLNAIATAGEVRMSAANFLEAAIVMDGQRDPRLSREFDSFIEDAEIRIDPVTEKQARLARAAYRDYGKGSGHPARLNLGDCFAYALAQDRREPLLYKGNHFYHTDIRSALTTD